MLFILCFLLYRPPCILFSKKFVTSYYVLPVLVRCIVCWISKTMCHECLKLEPCDYSQVIHFTWFPTTDPISIQHIYPYGLLAMTVKDVIYFYENLSISDICGSPGHAFGSCLYLHLAVYILILTPLHSLKFTMPTCVLTSGGNNPAVLFKI